MLHRNSIGASPRAGRPVQQGGAWAVVRDGSRSIQSGTHRAEVVQLGKQSSLDVSGQTRSSTVGHSEVIDRELTTTGRVVPAIASVRANDQARRSVVRFERVAGLAYSARKGVGKVSSYGAEGSRLGMLGSHSGIIGSIAGIKGATIGLKSLKGFEI